MNKIKKAIIACAGYGTRFLPETKSVPKEMLPIIDKPIIQYIVEELVESGIEDIIMVIRGSNYNLGNHFDDNFELENHLKINKKFDKLEEVKRLSQMANFVYIRQNLTLPYGNGTPLFCAKDLLNEGEYFAYIFADDLILSEKPCLSQLIEKSNEHGGAIIVGSQEVPMNQVHKYGIINLKDKDSGLISGIIEKPKQEEAPSNLADFGRFILSYDIIKEISKKSLGKDNELWLVDAINEVCKYRDVYNVSVEGEWLTTGDPLNYIKALIKFALKRDNLKEELLKFMHDVKE